MRFINVGALLGLGAALTAVPAQAQPKSAQQRLDALEAALNAQAAQITAQQKLIEDQRAQIEALRSGVTARIVSAPPTTADTAAQVDRLTKVEAALAAQNLKDQDAPKLTMQAGRPTFSSADGRFTISPRIVAQLDSAIYAQAAAGPLATDFRRGSVGGGRENSAARDLSNGAYFRRARIGFEGTFYRDISFRFLAEFGGAGSEGPARINDAFVAYTGLAPFTFQIGAFTPPANMDDGTGVEDTWFIERSTPAELSRTLGGADGRIGAGVRFATARWMGALTATTRTVNDAEVNDSQAALVGRVARLLYTDPDTNTNLHVGASGTYVLNPADQGPDATGARSPIRFRDRPELRVDSTRLIDTGGIDADSAYAIGAEFGAQYRNFTLQGEHFWYGIERRQPSALRGPRFTGWYVQGAWVITGEPRRYNMATGSFAAPRPFTPVSANGGWGAWELAVRYSRTDLNAFEGTAGTAAASDTVRGGLQSIWTIGLNWYLSTNTRMTFNWLNVDVERLNPAGLGNTAPFGSGSTTPPAGAQIGQKLDIWALRLQYGF